MPTLAQSKQWLPRKLRRAYGAPDQVWGALTASATHYDAERVLDHLNTIAAAGGAAPQTARFSKRPNRYSASNWWVDLLVWEAPAFTLCAFTDPDGTDLYLAAWGEGAEPVIAGIEEFLSALE